SRRDSHSTAVIRPWPLARVKITAELERRWIGWIRRSWTTAPAQPTNRSLSVGVVRAVDGPRGGVDEAGRLQQVGGHEDGGHVVRTIPHAARSRTGRLSADPRSPRAPAAGGRAPSAAVHP